MGNINKYIVLEAQKRLNQMAFFLCIYKEEPAFKRIENLNIHLFYYTLFYLRF